MPALFETLPLTVWLAAMVMLALAYTARYWLQGIFDIVNKAIGGIPFLGGLAKHAEGYVIGKINEAIRALRNAATAVWQAFEWSLRETVAAFDVFAGYVEDNWTAALGVVNGPAGAVAAALQALYSDAKSLVDSVAGDVSALRQTVLGYPNQWAHAIDRATTRLLGQAADYTDGQIAKLHAALDAHVASAVQTVEADIHAGVRAAVTEAEGYADTLKRQVETDIQAASTAAGNALASAVSGLQAGLAAVRAEAATLRATLEQEIGGASGAAAQALSDAVAQLDQRIGGALSTAEQAAASALTAAQTTVEGEIGQAASAAAAQLAATAGDLRGTITAASDAAQQAVSAARATVEGEISDAAQTAAANLQAAAQGLQGELASAVSASASALASARAAVEGEIAQASATAAAALADARTILQGEIDAVTATAAGIGAAISAAERAAAGELTDIYNLPADEIRKLLDRLDVTKLAGFGAGLVLVRGLVETIAQESGLDNAACRAKNKQICGTDPAAWTNLLTGLAAVGLAFDLRELAGLARDVADAAAPLVRDLAGAA